MAWTHMTEAEAARDLHAVLARVRQGEQIVIETGGAPVTLQTAFPERTVAEAIALAKDSDAVMDPEFAADMSEIVAMRKPRKSVWE